MQKVVLIIGIVLSALSKNYAQTPFTVSGVLKNSPSRVVYLEEEDLTTGIKTMKDSSGIGADGKFSITIKTNGENVYKLRLKNDVPPFVTVINDTNAISLEADFNKQFDFYNVSGSRSSKAIQDFLSRFSDMQRERFNNYYKIDSLKKNNGPSLLINNLNARQREITKEFKTYTQQLVQQSDKVPLSLFVLFTYQGMTREPNYGIDGFSGEEMLAFLDAMIRKFPGRKDLVGIRSSIESQIPKTLWVGKQAPEISLPDTEGKIVKLSSFRGKYVLVDFWASWCAPCRGENPNVVEAYNQFKEKNFTVLGVSLDKNMEAWKRAIVDDNLNWTHISDLKYWGSEVVPVYRFGSIPFNVLVDPTGKVVAENLRGSALKEKLNAILEGKMVRKTDNVTTYIIIAAVIIAGLLLAWFFVNNKKKKEPVKPQSRSQVKKRSKK